MLDQSESFFFMAAPLQRHRSHQAALVGLVLAASTGHASATRGKETRARTSSPFAPSSHHRAPASLLDQSESFFFMAAPLQRQTLGCTGGPDGAGGKHQAPLTCHERQRDESTHLESVCTILAPRSSRKLARSVGELLLHGGSVAKAKTRLH